MLGSVTTQDTPSIAVLAFANRSASADDEYFSDGLADELLNVLARIRGLRVAARTSAFSFKGKQATVAEIGHILNVATVLEGSVRKSGNRVRISVQLVKVTDGYQLWSETYDRTLDDIFAVQDDIAQSVVTELRVKLMGARDSTQSVVKEIDIATSTRSANPEAYRFCLQGRFFSNKRTPRDVMRAIGYFEQAIAIDSRYAIAHSGLGNAHAMVALYEGTDAADHLRLAEIACKEALLLDPLSADAHLTLGYIELFLRQDAEGWARETGRALELAPNDPEVIRRAGLRLLYIGDFGQARAMFERALALDPLFGVARINLSMAGYFDGQLDIAEQELQRALEIDPGFWMAHAHLSRLARIRGRYAECVESRARALDLRGDTDAGAFLRECFVTRDWNTFMRAVLAAPARAMYSPYEQALMFAELGEFDEAFAALDRGVEIYDQLIGWLKIDPLAEPLRSDPRFHALLKRVGFAK